MGYFADRGRVYFPVYHRYELGSRVQIEGPAIVEEVDSAKVIHPGYWAVVDGSANLYMRRVLRVPRFGHRFNR